MVRRLRTVCAWSCSLCQGSSASSVQHCRTAPSALRSSPPRTFCAAHAAHPVQRSHEGGLLLCSTLNLCHRSVSSLCGTPEALQGIGYGRVQDDVHWHAHVIQRPRHCEASLVWPALCYHDTELYALHNTRCPTCIFTTSGSSSGERPKRNSAKLCQLPSAAQAKQHSQVKCCLGPSQMYL